jgi:hypothetical protein
MTCIDSVSFIEFVGRPRTVLSHTPAICHSSQGESQECSETALIQAEQPDPRKVRMHGLFVVYSVSVNDIPSVSLRYYLSRSGQTELPAPNQLPSVPVFGEVPHSLVYIEHY